MDLRELRRLGPSALARRHSLAWRRATVGVVVFGLLFTLVGCAHDIPDETAAAEDFASALRSGTLDHIHFTNIANVEAQGQYRAALTPLLDAIGGEDPQITVTGVQQNERANNDVPQTATANFEWTWPLGGDANWSYDTQAEMVLNEPGFGQAREPQWEFTWDPTILVPITSPNEVVETRIIPPTRAEILDGSGEPLVTERPIVRLGIDKATDIDGVQMGAEELEESARSLAHLVSRAGHDVSEDDFAAKVAHAGPRDFVELIALREDDDSVNVEHALETIVGAGSMASVLPLAPNPDFASAVLGHAGEATTDLIAQSGGRLQTGDTAGLSGLQLQYDEQLAGAPGITIVATGGPGGSRELFTRPARLGTDVATTFDVELQERAETALADVTPAAAIVAIRPATGEIVAAASGPGSHDQDTALLGQFTPGATFKMINALAFARHGTTADSTVTCDPEIVVAEETFTNAAGYPEWAVGQMPFREAFAQSCNTAMISAGESVSQADLVTAAQDLGLGVLSPVGLPAFVGDVPADADALQHANTLLGQDRVLVSPLAMARAAASIAVGHRVDPFLVRSHPTSDTAVTGPESGLTASEAAAIRDLMRSVVTEGNAWILTDVPGVVGAASGTAQAAVGGQTHAWMVAITNSASPLGELAIAVFVESGTSGATTAGPVMYKFLTGHVYVPPPPPPVYVPGEDDEDSGWTGGGGDDIWADDPITGPLTGDLPNDEPDDEVWGDEAVAE